MPQGTLDWPVAVPWRIVPCWFVPCLSLAGMSICGAHIKRGLPGQPIRRKAAPPAAMAAGATASSAAATEHSDTTPLSQLLIQESGQEGAYELTVVRAEIIDYTYPWQGKQIATQKVQVLLQSHNPIEYCLGVAPRAKGAQAFIRCDEDGLHQVLKRFAVDTTWRFTAVKLLDDTSASIHTTSGKTTATATALAIDLHKTTATAMLQSTPVPRTPLRIFPILTAHCGHPPILRTSSIDLHPDAAAHVHATEQDLPIQHNLTTTTAKRLPRGQRGQRFQVTATTAESITRRVGIYLHVEYELLLYWARSRPVARVHMTTVPQRRACNALRATWALQCMSQLCCYDLPACQGCGLYPTSATCSNCCIAWCPSCRAWSSLCRKCNRPRHSLADTGEFVAGVGGPGGNGSSDTPLRYET